MGLTAALIGIGLVGGAVASKLTSPKVKIPDAPPPVPPVPPIAAVTAPEKTPEAAATTAVKQQKKRVAGAVGRSDTILTGPKGLGQIQPAQTTVKTLLGY